MLDVERDTRTARDAVAARQPAAPTAVTPDPGSTAVPRPADGLDRVLQRAVLRRQPGTELAEAEPRVVEGAEGEVELPPLTLMDFMRHAIAESGRRDRRRNERATRAAAARAEAERQEKERLDAEERRRLEAEQRERERLEAEEQARREAEEKERLRLEAEEMERLRLEAEEKERLRLEAERQAKALEDWQDGLANIASELADEVQNAVGAELWPYLTDSEREDAVRDVLALASKPITCRSEIEGRLRRRSKGKTNKIKIDLDAVLNELRATSRQPALAAAAKLRVTAQTRRTEQEQAQAEAAALAVPVTTAELNDLYKSKPTGNMLSVLYRALHQNWVTFVHADTYRTRAEQAEKRGSQHGPFSREYWVRVYGTDANPGRYERANWVVHVHYRSSATPRTSEYLHLKSWAERKKPINHVINKKLEQTLGPLTEQVIDAGVDNEILSL